MIPQPHSFDRMIRIGRIGSSCLLALIFLAARDAAAVAQPQEFVSEIVFHGNHSTSQDELQRLAGVRIGEPLTAGRIDQIQRQLMQSGDFEWVEVRKRYRSLSKSRQVVLVIAVKEKIPASKKWMFFPILSGSDEYGFTYGARFTAIDLLGLQERISIPLSWGGIKQAALEGMFNLDSPLADRAFFQAGISSRQNPHFEIDDRRVELRGGLRRRLASFQLNLEAGWNNVDFDPIEEDFLSYKAGIVLDTRQDINLPGNAFYAGFEYEFVDIRGRDSSFHRYRFDLRGYKRVFGQASLAAQFLYQGSDSRLPDYQRPFLGGAATLRGHPAGEFIGDVLTLTSVELRYPLTSPLAVYKGGFTVFLDSGAVYDHGRSFRSADFKHGIGAGLFIFVFGLGLKVEVAHDLNDSTRLHFSTRFRF